QWFTPLEQMATAHGWRLLSLTQGSCTFLDVTVYDKKNDREFTNCGPWREAVRQYMREQSVDIVLLSAHWNLLSADTHKTISAREWNDHLPGLLDSLRADGMEPIVIGDSPNPDTTVPDCVAENTHRTDRCAAEQYGATERAIAEAIRPITAAAEVGFVEPGEWVCTDSGVCPPIIGDILVYRDGNHLSDTVAEWLEPLLDATLAPFVDAWMQWVAVSR
ncbi:MAG TPA: SGNH hydrolase domain-containing protein, partial [Ilumatobacteraceae bacterium]|nr:SGNH hydrolase domain-containing protein [Ilumatobacteraceae bacterium]